MGTACWRAFNNAMDTNTNSSSRLRRKAYPFQLRDPLNGRKVRARFLADVNAIDGCVAAWEIVGSLPATRTPQMSG